ncbi:hypothetical protein AVEN_107641-1, partial [Araneus ventricosus]
GVERFDDKRFTGQAARRKFAKLRVVGKAHLLQFRLTTVRFPSREQRPHEKKSASPFDIGGKQQELHLDIANETGARERTSHRGPPQCR